jgi:hypothetical protein
MSAGKTLMEYDVFRHNNTDDENFKRINEFFKQVLQEDKDLCNGTQKNLEGGIFINGQLHPEKEKVCSPMTSANLYRLTHSRDPSSSKRLFARWSWSTVLEKRRQVTISGLRLRSRRLP